MPLSNHGGRTMASFSSPSRKLSQAQSRRSASSSASSMRSSINRAESTITALKCLENDRLADGEETESVTSSNWDTDLEDNLSDEDRNEDQDGKKETSLEQEAYLKLCGKLGVVPVTRFGDQIGQEEVKVTHRFVGETGAKAIAAILLGNHTTTKINLGDNAFGERGGAYIGAVIQRNTSLTEMILSNNNLNRDGVSSITNALKTNTTMRRLDLSGNGLNDKDASILSEAIKHNNSLRYLNLSYNNFAELSGNYFGSALQINSGLLELDLSWNHIRLGGAASFCNSLCYNDTLEKLDLSWNGFDDLGTTTLCEALKRNTGLTELLLNNNRLSDVGIQNVAKGIWSNKTLEGLDLSHNPVFNSCDGVLRILEAVEKNRCGLMKLMITNLRLNDDSVLLIQKLEVEKQDFVINYGCKKSDEFMAKKEEVNPFEFVKEYMEKNKLHSSDLFKRLSKNGEFQDSMSTKDFTEGVKRLNIMNVFYVEKLVSMLDCDSDGEIDYSEFVKQS